MSKQTTDRRQRSVRKRQRPDASLAPVLPKHTHIEQVWGSRQVPSVPPFNPAVEWWNVDGLTPYPRNARTHSTKQINQIAASIKEFGFTNPAHEIETAVCGRILSLLADGGALADVLRLALDPLQREALTDVARGIPKAWQAAEPGTKCALLRKILVKAILNDDRIMLESSTDRIVGAFEALAGQPLPHSHGTPRPQAFRLSAEIRIERCRGETRVVVPDGTAQDDRKRPNAALIKAVARAHHWCGQLFSREGASIRIIAERAHVSARYVRRILFLAFLAPDIVDAILDGRQPDGLTVDRLEDGIPLDWSEQRRNLGFPAA